MGNRTKDKTDRREGVVQATLEKSNDCNKQDAFVPHHPWVYITAGVESGGQNGVLSSPSDQRLELVRPMKSAATSKEHGGADAGRTLLNKAGSVVSGLMDWWVSSTGKRRSQKVKWSQRKQSHRRL